MTGYGRVNVCTVVEERPLHAQIKKTKNCGALRSTVQKCAWERKRSLAGKVGLLGTSLAAGVSVAIVQHVCVMIDISVRVLINLLPLVR